MRIYPVIQRRRQDFGSGGGHFRGRPRMVSWGADAPWTIENFENLQKILKKIAKSIILGDFLKTVKNLS